MEISYPELWLLEVPVRCDTVMPFPFVVETEFDRECGFSQRWGVPLNGLSLRQIAETMWSLHQRGEVEFWSGSWAEAGQELYRPSSICQVEDCLEREWQTFRTAKQSASHYHRYSLTPTGMARWEAYAQPDWSRFRGEGRFHDGQPGLTTWFQFATNERFAREVLEVMAMDVFHPVTLDWRNALVSDIAPWEAMPGKTFARGVKVSVPAMQSEQRGILCQEWSMVGANHSEYYRRFGEICRWYQRGVEDHPDRPQPPE